MTSPSDLDAAAEDYVAHFSADKLKGAVFEDIRTWIMQALKAGAAWKEEQAIGIFEVNEIVKERDGFKYQVACLDKANMELKAEMERQAAIADKEYRLRDAYRAQAEKLASALGDGNPTMLQEEALMEYEAFKKGLAE